MSSKLKLKEILQNDEGKTISAEEGSLQVNLKNTVPICEAVDNKDKIEQLVTDRSTKRKFDSTYPAWNELKSRPSIKLWELVAISKDIRPSKLEIVKKEDRTRYTGYPARLKTAISWVGDGLTIVEHPDNGAMAKHKMFSPVEFVECMRAKAKRKKIAEGLLKITSVKTNNDSFIAQVIDESLFEPLPISGIAEIFTLDLVSVKNQELWAEYARQAIRNGLTFSRVAKGAGRAKSTFDPMKVGEWLVLKGFMSQEKVNRCLANNLPLHNAHLKEMFVQK